ncbi:bacillithiol biosynthesis BshC [Candidatus Bathyarchaeota archaeon]|nr:bacillithiol biosynthesis BshC [Candidatus Bathyarchaeota archaeon]
MSQTRPSAHQLYSKYINNKRLREGALGDTALGLWGKIPLNLDEAVRHLQKVQKKDEPESEHLETLKKNMKRHLRRLGILTEGTSQKIDQMHKGVVETGQQPNCLGGPSLILNKVAYMKYLAEKAGIAPLYFVVDYDGIQPELTNTRLPSPSPHGLILKYPVEPESENCPIYTLDNPSEEWLTQNLEKITSNYRGLLKGTPQNEKIQQNLNHLLTIIKAAFHSTRNVSEFSTKIIGTLLNVESEQGVPLYWYSMPNTRQLFLGGYETLLSEPTRSRFVEATNKATRMVEASGYLPQIGVRPDDYVPFYLECTECNSTRVELSYHRSSGSSTSTVKGKCSKCGEKYDYSFNAGSPDLTEIIDYISPRVDTRQFIVGSVIPVLARIGGPAETSYFAELVPVAKALGLPFPIIMQYTRVFYNTPWIESKAEAMSEVGLSPIANTTLFNALGRWVKSKNEGDEQKLGSAHKEIQYSIASSYRNLVNTLESLQKEMESIKLQLGESRDRSTLITELRDKQKTMQEIELYLSWAFGRFSAEKFGQEVNWNWIDLSVVAGLSDIMGVYERLYNIHTPNSSVFYINL